jgi:hypothetical protein
MPDAACIKSVIDEFNLSQNKAFDIFDDVLDAVNKAELEHGKQFSQAETDVFTRNRISKSINDDLLQRSISDAYSAHAGVERVNKTHDKLLEMADDENRVSGGSTHESGVVTPGSRYTNPIYLLRSILIGGQHSIVGIRNNVMTVIEERKKRWNMSVASLKQDKEISSVYDTLIDTGLTSMTPANRKIRDDYARQLSRSVFDTFNVLSTNGKVQPLPANATPVQKIANHIAVVMTNMHSEARASGAMLSPMDVRPPLLMRSEIVGAMTKEQFVNAVFDHIDWDHAAGGSLSLKGKAERIAFLHEKHLSMTGNATREATEGYRVKGNPTFANAVAWDLVAKDGDAWHDLNRQFGRDHNMLEAMSNQVETLSRATGLMDFLGPDVVKGMNSLVSRTIDDVKNGRIAVDPAKKDSILAELENSFVNNGLRDMSSGYSCVL